MALVNIINNQIMNLIMNLQEYSIQGCKVKQTMSSGMEREKLEKTISIEEEGNGRNESEPMTIPSSSHNQEYGYHIYQ